MYKVAKKNCYRAVSFSIHISEKRALYLFEHLVCIFQLFSTFLGFFVSLLFHRGINNFVMDQLKIQQNIKLSIKQFYYHILEYKLFFFAKGWVKDSMYRNIANLIRILINFMKYAYF